LNREEIASSLFMDGFNCAQSVLSAFKDKTNISEENLLKISCGLGAGMGKLQQTCGAVTGAYLVIGLLNGNCKSQDKSLKENTYRIVKEFDNNFKKIYHTTNCKELLKCDLNTEEGRSYFKNNKLFKEICLNCVKSSVQILNDLI